MLPNQNRDTTSVFKREMLNKSGTATDVQHPTVKMQPLRANQRESVGVSGPSGMMGGARTSMHRSLNAGIEDGTNRSMLNHTVTGVSSQIGADSADRYAYDNYMRGRQIQETQRGDSNKYVSSATGFKMPQTQSTLYENYSNKPNPTTKSISGPMCNRPRERNDEAAMQLSSMINTARAPASNAMLHGSQEDINVRLHCDLEECDRLNGSIEGLRPDNKIKQHSIHELALAS